MIEQPTLIQIYYFCKKHYYCDDGTLWEPFELYDKEIIDEYIYNDALALADFLGIEVKHTDYLKMMKGER